MLCNNTMQHHKHQFIDLKEGLLLLKPFLSFTFAFENSL